MRSFKEWISEDLDSWRFLNDHLIARIGRDVGADYYERLVVLLRRLGLGEEADELLMILPSREDMDFGKRTAPGGGSIGSVVRHANDRDRLDRHSAMSLALNRHLLHLDGLVEKKFEDKGWPFEA